MNTFLGIGRPATLSAITNVSWPPSSTGKGKALRTARFTETAEAKPTREPVSKDRERVERGREGGRNRDCVCARERLRKRGRERERERKNDGEKERESQSTYAFTCALN